MAYFADKLLDLLPPIYRESDVSGDLRTFLSIPSATLDEMKELIDRLPDIWDVGVCDPRFLPLLSEIVGCSFDPTRDPDTQRREIREVIEQYRRKGTIPSIRRSLVNIGWRGGIEETFRNALRLNKRSITNSAKLPGRIHSLGVYRVECRNLVPGVRRALVEQHPAGIKVFFLQWLFSRESMEDTFQAALRRTVSLHSTGRIHDVFVVGRRLLNSDFRLTKKQSTWHYWRITDQVTLTQGFERAAVLINRWHARKSGPKLNGFALNTESLLDVELSERRLEMTCVIRTSPVIERAAIRLSRQNLNRSALAVAENDCRFVFRQKGFRSEAAASLEMAANLYRVTRWPGG